MENPSRLICSCSKISVCASLFFFFVVDVFNSNRRTRRGPKQQNVIIAKIDSLETLDLTFFTVVDLLSISSGKLEFSIELLRSILSIIFHFFHFLNERMKSTNQRSLRCKTLQRLASVPLSHEFKKCYHS